MLANPAFYEVNIIPSSFPISHNFVTFLGGGGRNKEQGKKNHLTRRRLTREIVFEKRKKDANVSYISRSKNLTIISNSINEFVTERQTRGETTARFTQLFSSPIYTPQVCIYIYICIHTHAPVMHYP